MRAAEECEREGNRGVRSGRQGGVREGRGGERLREEVFYRGKSGKHFPLVFKERVRGRVDAQRERGSSLALYNLRHVRRSGKPSWTR